MVRQHAGPIQAMATVAGDTEEPIGQGQIKTIGVSQ